MTNQTPIERGAEALMKAVLAGSRTLSPAQATDAAQTAYESIDTNQLATVIGNNMTARNADGLIVVGNSAHIALAIKNWLTGKAEA